MKVGDYIPYFGLFYNQEYYTSLNGKQISLNELFENYSESELSIEHIEQLNYFDLFSLQKALKNFDETNIEFYLRMLFDNYKDNGGKPLNWLNFLFESILCNPNNYEIKHRTVIEKKLIEWFEIYKNIELDYSSFTKIEHPFKNDEINEIFNFLDKGFKPESKVKYSYIFDFLKDNIESSLNETAFFNYIMRIKNIKMNPRTQPSATASKKIKLVEELYQDYLNQIEM